MTGPKTAAGERTAERQDIADEILAKANAIVDKLSIEYPGYALRDIENLASHIENIAAGKSFLAEIEKGE